jgi:hypothetical protein
MNRLVLTYEFVLQRRTQQSRGPPDHAAQPLAGRLIRTTPRSRPGPLCQASLSSALGSRMRRIVRILCGYRLIRSRTARTMLQQLGFGPSRLCQNRGGGRRRLRKARVLMCEPPMERAVTGAEGFRAGNRKAALLRASASLPPLQSTHLARMARAGSSVVQGRGDHTIDGSGQFAHFGRRWPIVGDGST